MQFCVKGSSLCQSLSKNFVIENFVIENFDSVNIMFIIKDTNVMSYLVYSRFVVLWFRHVRMMVSCGPIKIAVNVSFCLQTPYTASKSRAKQYNESRVSKFMLMKNKWKFSKFYPENHPGEKTCFSWKIQIMIS